MAPTRSLAEALVSPCLSCTTAPCCTHLPLHTFPVTNLLEFDHARYLLNFDRIGLGVSSTGNWSAYYRAPCRYLDKETFGCTIHGTERQPNICVNYNPYQCWYRKVLSVPAHDEFLEVDRARLDWLAARIGLDQDNRIVTVPDWQEMVAAFATMPVADVDMYTPPPPALPDGWDVVSPPGVRHLDGHVVRQPCDGCSATCCSTLIFPLNFPTNASGLDYVQFCLGFPGIEVAITDDSWSLVVKTRCRHLEGTRCGVYGKEERPLLCRYYDAWKCTYRVEFGTANPQGFLRVRMEEFDALTAALPLDGEGNLLPIPPAERLRELISR